ncbi:MULTISPECIES: isoprenylcysteine carboxyl methyltransferase family protein [unclassified Bacillus (in: firmicutes)]|uniref:isoprenylcysteine carboxyl methyltransferase family protein n=1 Tax=unclassified Bacillus (in: firmicutes) TaxID=185979 RepID=UPI001BE59792|nr:MULTISPECIES: isoprenylcysteine carboxyl methyltransferase family protein [unclassified Bacillus (in: firmicutes)]MBT2639035.1 isoprenylcysteine carboxyl methyltransferase family protein [Bacillus sp. ISL-39]MBT2641981.1 isoprenylcysteine carboxyl methyltransferase family protein [Bacillus sp. ISL-41]MBT2662356.1 isoprenylcysteine carboxyl methyltransferase family protein [Bacillus sp. ISL-45]
MVFLIFIGLIIFQRLTELVIARKNEAWMKAQGAIEFGQGHYPAMVSIHTAFFIFFILEVIFFDKNLSGYWPALLALFIFTQVMRIWSLSSLGRFWNTKIIILPGANVIKRGPYKIIKHPNYLIVAIELIVIPLMFNAYITMAVFTLLNILILSIRIPAEEKALRELTMYESEFSNQGRFVPNLLNKCDN